MKQSKAFAIAGLVGLVYLLQKEVSASAKLTVSQIKRLAEQEAHYFGLDPKMVRAIIQIESSGDPSAFRFELHLMDMSMGLMQTLGGTVKWLANEMGYTRYGKWGDGGLSHSSLYDPEISIYFGCAYLKWLSTYRGQDRSTEFIVRGYNGGQDGINRSATEYYWTKYQKAYGELS